MITFIKIALFLLVCLFVFMIIYDHNVYKKKVGESVKSRFMQVILSPAVYSVFKIVVISAILYLIYSLLHDTSFF